VLIPTPLSQKVDWVGRALSTGKDRGIASAVPLDEVSTNFTVNAPELIIVAQSVIGRERQCAPLEQLIGTLLKDSLKECAAHSTWLFPADFSRRRRVAIEYRITHVPELHG
jgi:methylmalonyl-CoA mutase N-terminal domain/subunit